MEINLTGKVALVTGAGRGIGHEILSTLAQEGAIAIGLDVRSEILEELEARFKAEGWQGRACHCDVRDAAAIQQVVDGVARDYGRVDLLVNNAGVSGSAPVEELEEEVWDRIQEINLKGTFLMCRAVIPIMKRQREGRIINAASFAALVPSYGGAAYAASKAGVCSLTRVLAGELGPWNITVNCYSPGMIPTEMNRFADARPERQERLLDTLSLRRWGAPSDIASLICFLASDHASYITGAMIDISGGKLATQIPRIAYERARESGDFSG